MMKQIFKYRHSRDELAHIQFVRLREILNHAYKYSQFYRCHYQSFDFHPEQFKSIADLKKIPMVRREQIKLVPSEQFVANPNREKLALHTTSGSSGIPVKIYHTRGEKRKLLWSCLRSYFEAGMGVREITVALRDPIDIKPLNLIQRLGFLRYVYYNVFDPISETYDRITKTHREIDILKGYSTDLFALVSLAVSDKVRGRDVMPKVKCVYTDSEVLDDRVRDYLIEKLNCPLLDFYASVECGMIAFQVESRGEYLVNEDTVIVEPWKVVPEATQSDSILSETLMTSLCVKTSPIIRYEIGDIIEFAALPENLKGRERLRLRKIHGKYLDFIILPNGSILSPHVPKQELTHLAGLKKFQVVQERVDYIRVNLDKDSSFTQETEMEIRKRLARAFGAEVKVELFEVPGLGRGTERKFKVIESKIAQEYLEKATSLARAS
ncbi:MAG: hypothetical protein NTV08_10655 [Verrucomicrobia bacterium]|nr:hypothetical protein [Verrucomicrobiota bacterium]